MTKIISWGVIAAVVGTLVFVVYKNQDSTPVGNVATEAAAGQLTIATPIINEMSVDMRLSPEQMWLGRSLCEPLFVIDKDNALKPIVAQEVTWSNDHKTARVTLAQKKFSDGTTLKAKDVVSSLKRCLKPISTVSVAAGKFDVNQIRELNDNEIEVNFKESNPLFFHEIASYYCPMTAEKSTDNVLKGATCTGRYALQSYTNGEITLAKKVEEGVDRAASSDDTSPHSLRFVFVPQRNDFETIRRWGAGLSILSRERRTSDDYKLVSFSTSTRSVFLYFNAKTEPFNNAKLREAARNYLWASAGLDAINSEKISQGGLFPYGMPGYEKNQFSQDDLGRFKKDLQEQGYSASNPLEFEILILANIAIYQDFTSWVERVSQGVLKVKVTDLPVNEFFEQRVRPGKFQAALYRIDAVSTLPESYLASFRSNFRGNLGRAPDTSCDGSIAGVFGEPNATQRQEKLEKAEACVLKQACVIPLYSNPVDRMAVSRDWFFDTANALHPNFVQLSTLQRKSN